jgi:hypothetical protein
MHTLHTRTQGWVCKPTAYYSDSSRNAHTSQDYVRVYMHCCSIKATPATLHNATYALKSAKLSEPMQATQNKQVESPTKRRHSWRHNTPPGAGSCCIPCHLSCQLATAPRTPSQNTAMVLAARLFVCSSTKSICRLAASNFLLQQQDPCPKNKERCHEGLCRSFIGQCWLRDLQHNAWLGCRRTCPVVLHTQHSTLTQTHFWFDLQHSTAMGHSFITHSRSPQTTHKGWVALRAEYKRCHSSKGHRCRTPCATGDATSTPTSQAGRGQNALIGYMPHLAHASNSNAIIPGPQTCALGCLLLPGHLLAFYLDSNYVQLIANTVTVKITVESTSSPQASTP